MKDKCRFQMKNNELV